MAQRRSLRNSKQPERFGYDDISTNGRKIEYSSPAYPTQKAKTVLKKLRGQPKLRKPREDKENQRKNSTDDEIIVLSESEEEEVVVQQKEQNKPKGKGPRRQSLVKAKSTKVKEQDYQDDNFVALQMEENVEIIEQNNNNYSASVQTKQENVEIVQQQNEIPLTLEVNNNAAGQENVSVEENILEPYIVHEHQVRNEMVQTDPYLNVNHAAYFEQYSTVYEYNNRVTPMDEFQLQNAPSFTDYTSDEFQAVDEIINQLLRQQAERDRQQERDRLSLHTPPPCCLSMPDF